MENKEKVIQNLLDYREHLYKRMHWGEEDSSYEDRRSWWSCLCHHFMGVLDWVQLYEGLDFDEVNPIYEEFRNKSEKMLDL